MPILEVEPVTEKESQKIQILQFMLNGNAVTDAIARELFGCSRVGARIWELRHEDNIPVLDDFEYSYDQNGKVVKKWKKYWIAAAQQAQSAS